MERNDEDSTDGKEDELEIVDEDYDRKTCNEKKGRGEFD